MAGMGWPNASDRIARPLILLSFPWSGRHAQRGIALGMLHALVAFARGQLHVGDLHVVLIIQPHFSCAGRIRHYAASSRRRPSGPCRGLGRWPGQGPCPWPRWLLPLSNPRHARHSALRPCRHWPRRRRARSPRHPRPKAGGWHRGGRNDAPRPKTSLPPQCDHRCTTGDQPPDMATASQSNSSVKAVPLLSMRQISTPVTALPPLTLRMPLPVRTVMPAARAAATSGPLASGRASTTAGTPIPARRSAIAVR